MVQRPCVARDEPVGRTHIGKTPFRRMVAGKVIERQVLESAGKSLVQEGGSPHGVLRVVSKVLSAVRMSVSSDGDEFKSGQPTVDHGLHIVAGRRIGREIERPLGGPLDAAPGAQQGCCTQARGQDRIPGQTGCEDVGHSRLGESRCGMPPAFGFGHEQSDEERQ